MATPFIKAHREGGLTYIAMEDRVAEMLLSLTGSVAGIESTTYRGWTTAMYYKLREALPYVDSTGRHFNGTIEAKELDDGHM